MTEAEQILKSAAKHLPPPITIAQIRQERNNLDSTVNPILNKPPPKAPSPPKEEQPPTETGDSKPMEQNENQNSQEQKQNSSEEKMEWQST